MHTESVLLATLESIEDGLLIVSNSGRISHYNRRFLEIWSIPKERMADPEDQILIDCVASQLVDPERFKKDIREIYDNAAPTHDTLQFKDGRIIERFSSPLKSSQEEPERMWLFRDVTARVRAESALQDRQEQLSSIFRAAPCGISLLIDRRAIEINDAVCRITGYSREELLSQN